MYGECSPGFIIGGTVGCVVGGMSGAVIVALEDVFVEDVVVPAALVHGTRLFGPIGFIAGGIAGDVVYIMK